MTNNLILAFLIPGCSLFNQFASQSRKKLSLNFNNDSGVDAFHFKYGDWGGGGGGGGGGVRQAFTLPLR